ncbi:vomeronasal type-2 receptor 26-like [Dendropsophus ebraccatus]|uniref:vomeronasal type-2 receptor 26-like n=1 Tax=Dendropsophus ebraccatus TaxID=150705 RepID=UPI0038311349
MSVLTLEILLLLLLLLITFGFVNTDRSSACKLNPIPAYEEYEYVQDGDIIIGGIFSVNCLIAGIKYNGMSFIHSSFCIKSWVPLTDLKDSVVCYWLSPKWWQLKSMTDSIDNTTRHRGSAKRPLPQFYRNLQLFRFTIDQINKDPTLLPNMTLGYHIYDSCAHPGKAIRSVLQILSGPGATVPNYSCRKNRRMAGFIGDQSTSTTLPITQLLTLYKYPVISYGAIDRVLNSQHFPNFFQTVQNNYETFNFLCQLIKFFGWIWIGIITSFNESALRESNMLFHFLNSHQICVAFILWEGVNIQSTVRKHHRYHEIARKQSVQVVILCGTYHDILFESSTAEWLKGVTMILAPSWAPHIVLIEKYPEIFNCSLSLEPESEVTAEFVHFVDDFYPLKYPKDVLLKNLWMATFHCLSGNRRKDDLYEWIYDISFNNCTGLERMRSTWNHLSQQMFDPVYNAVMSLAETLNRINLSKNKWDGHQTSYRYQLRRNLKVTSDYAIHNNIIVNGRLEKVKVGVFHSQSTEFNTNEINKTLIQWKTGNNEVPKSVCTESCLPGYRKVLGTTIYHACYKCIKCFEGEISDTIDSETCRRCPDHEWPNVSKTQCISKQIEFLYYFDVISVTILSGSMLLLTLTAVILGIFIRYRDTPIVRANNKNLSFVLLVSIMLSFLSVFLFLGRPVDTTCRLRQISTGILLSISISSLLAKTIMVYMAFRATKPGSVWSRWSGVTLPNCVLLVCSSVQGVICMSWVTLSPPFQELDTHSYKEKMVVQCNEGSDLWFFSVLGYMGILAAVSFITAFLARTLPDSFNEAKYITFSMLVFCSVWIAMIPAYLSTKGKYMVAVEIFAILTSNAGLLGWIASLFPNGLKVFDQFIHGRHLRGCRQRQQRDNRCLREGVGLQVSKIDQYVDDNTSVEEVPEDVIDELLEDRRGITQAKGNDQVFKLPIPDPFVILTNSDKIVHAPEVQFREDKAGQRNQRSMAGDTDSSP